MRKQLTSIEVVIPTEDRATSAAAFAVDFCPNLPRVLRASVVNALGPLATDCFPANPMVCSETSAGCSDCRHSGTIKVCNKRVRECYEGSHPSGLQRNARALRVRQRIYDPFDPQGRHQRGNLLRLPPVLHRQ